MSPHTMPSHSSSLEMPGAAGAGPSIADVVALLRAHVMFIVVCALAGAGLAGLYATTRKPLFEASSVLRIDPSRAGSLGVSEPGMADPMNEGAVIQTEIGILNSDAVMIRAVQSIAPAMFVELTGYPRSSSGFSSRGGLTPEEEQALGELHKATAIKLLDGTKLVRITVRNHSAAAAAALANQLVTAYGEHGVAGRASSVSQLNNWLRSQMAELASQGAASQEHLASFQETRNILGTDGSNTTVSDRLRMLNERLTAAEAERISKEGQAQALERSPAEAVAEPFVSLRLAELQRQQGQVYAQFAQLSSKFGDGYPPLEDLRAQMRAVDAEVARNVESIRERLRHEVQAARDVEGALKSEYERQTRAAYVLNRSQAEYAALQAEVAISRELYGSLRAKLQQAIVEAEVSAVNVMLVDTARPPTEPLGPRAGFLLVGGFLLGTFSGTAVAFMADSVKASIRRFGTQPLSPYSAVSGAG